MDKFKALVEVVNDIDSRVHAALFVLTGAVLFLVHQHEGAAALVSGGLAIMENKRPS